MRPQIYINFNTSVKVANFKAKLDEKKFSNPSRFTKVNGLYTIFSLQVSPILVSYAQREALLLIEETNGKPFVDSNNQLAQFYSYSVSEFFKEAPRTIKHFNFGVYPQSYLQLASLGIAESFRNWNTFTSTLHYSSMWQGSFNRQDVSYTIRDRLLYSTLLSSLGKSTNYRNVNSGYARLLTQFFYSAKKVRFEGTSGVIGGANQPVLFSSAQNLRSITRGTLFPSAFTSQKGLFTIRRKAFALINSSKGIAFRYNTRFTQMNLKTKSTVRYKKGLALENKASVVIKNPYSVKLYATNRTNKQPSYYGLTYLKKLITLLTGNRFSIYALNARSISRFAFDKELYERYSSRTGPSIIEEISLSSGKKKSFRFLRSLERERVSRFRYVAVYIQDLIRISFFSIYLKKSGFLSAFLAFSLSKLPRNRKETQFLRFLRKLVKVFASQRKEIFGLRIRFQGRVNRWRRTKHIIGEKGSIPFQAYDTRIDYGIAQAITRKGALGIRLWIAYKPAFSDQLNRSILQYAHLKAKQIT